MGSILSTHVLIIGDTRIQNLIGGVYSKNLKTNTYHSDITSSY